MEKLNLALLLRHFVNMGPDIKEWIQWIQLLHSVSYISVMTYCMMVRMCARYQLTNPFLLPLALQTVRQMWPYICQFIEKLFHETIEPAVKGTNSHLSTFCFSKIDMGDKVSIKTYQQESLPNPALYLLFMRCFSTIQLTAALLLLEGKRARASLDPYLVTWLWWMGVSLIVSRKGHRVVARFMLGKTQVWGLVVM